MVAVILHDTPRRPCVTFLSTVLVAAPVAYGVAFGGASMLLRSSPVLVEAHAEEAPQTSTWVTKASLRSLPVPALQKVMAARPAPILQRIVNSGGLTFLGSAFSSPEGVQFQLEGLKIPAADSRCRRLDGVDVSCHERIAARLDVLAKAHPIRCRIQQTGEISTARCMAGKVDVAEDLVRAGLARADTRSATAT